MTQILEAQKYLKEQNLDGWLLYDFQGKNTLARYFLNLKAHQMTTRRFFYWIPTQGSPLKLVHAIESSVLDHLPGEKQEYSSWQSLEQNLKNLLQNSQQIAMEYSPKNSIPYVSLVDAGTVDLIRSFGVKVASSADFLPHFTALLSEDQIASQIRAASALDQIVKNTWKWIRDHLILEKVITEYDVQQKILQDFQLRHLINDHAPIVAVNTHSANPHYEPLALHSSVIRKGDFILIDLWAKEKSEKAIYGDITRVAVAEKQPTTEQQKIFTIVRRAQKAAVELVKSRFSQKERIEGWEVDAAARAVISEAGYADHFTHRTGHNIEIDLHGSGAHMDNLEMHDTRPILPSTCFSIEPGIYLPQRFGIRLELDLIIHKEGRVEITGGEQEAIFCLF